MKQLLVLTLLLLLYAIDGQEIVSNDITRKIPLRIYHLLPSNLLLQNRQAITVIYNRAVIPIGSDFGLNLTEDTNKPFTIGCNVPGKYRWVTTSIFRFDPDINWPTDLNCTLKVNGDIETFDGNKLNEDIPIRQYYTPKLTMTIESVASLMAQNVTGNNWDSDIGHIDGPEVPPDSIVTLSFNNPISIEKVKTGLSIKRKLNDKIFVNDLDLRECDGDRKNCLQLKIPSFLQHYEKFSFELAKGTSYHSLSGELSEILSNNFRSLLEFKFYFQQNSNVRYNRWNLWLIHGLSYDSTIENLSTFIKITPESKFLLKRINLGMVQLCGSFLPNTEYSIDIRGTNQILDGFELPLKSSNTKFTTGSHADFMEIPADDFVSFTKSPPDWQTFIRKGSNNRVNFYNIDESNLKSTFSIYQTGIDSTPKSSIFPMNNHTLIVSSLNASELLSNSGIFLSQKITNNPYGEYQEYHFINEAPFVVNMISLTNGILIVWVVQSTGFENVESAKVAIFQNGNLFKEQFTNNNGIAEFENIYSNNGAVNAVVTLEDNMVIIRYVSTTYMSSSSSIKMTYMITDRKIYNLGDIIHVKGYTRIYDEKTQEFTMPKDGEKIEIFSSFGTESKLATYISEYGSFYTKFEIPENSTFGMQSLRTGDYNAHISFVIADPRLPTAVLTISSKSNFISLDSTIKIDINAATYTGIGIDDYPITIKWNVYKPSQCPIDFKMDFRASIICQPNILVYHDEKQFKTGKNGMISFDYSLPNHPNVTLDRILEIEAEMKSITRETINKKISIPISTSNWKIKMIPSNFNPIPGYKFYLSTSIHDLIGKLIPNIPIDSVIYEWDGDTPIFDMKGNPNITNPPLQSCSSKSSTENEFDCSYILEKPLKYVIISSSVDSFGNKIYSHISIGKTKVEWEKNKLSRIGSINFHLDKKEYLVGETAIIKFENPFKKGILFWVVSNREFTENFRQTVDIGIQSIKIPIKNEYKKGAVVSIILYSPENEGLDLKIKVPVSKVYDPYAPQSVSSQLNIKVIDDQKPISIKINSETKIFQPRSTVKMKISLNDGITNSPMGGEITYWLVDKSILDLKPNLIEKSNIFKTNEYLTNLITTSVDSFSSKNIYQRTFQTLKRRYEKDGYITQNWPLNNYAFELDLSDEEYFQKYFTLLTEYRKQLTQDPIEYLEDGGFSKRALFAHDSSAVNTNGIQSIGGPSSTELNEEKNFLRSMFSLTPVFVKSAIVDSSGTTEISFDLPDNVGSYVFNVMAINNNMYGYENDTIISRKNVNLNPSLPRFVRIGDGFTSGCSVSLTNENHEGVYIVSASIPEESQNVLKFFDGIQSKEITLRRNQPQEVTFSFVGIGIGDAKIIFKITGKSNDAIQVSLAILGIQEPVFVGSSFSLIGNDSRIEQLSHVPSFSDYELNITSGVGKLPSMLALSQQILDSSNDFYMSYPYCIPNAYFSYLIPYFVSIKYPQEVDEYFVSNSKKTFFQIIDKLRKCTHPEFGLQFGFINDIYSNPRYNDFMNAIGIYVSQKLSIAKIPQDLVNIWEKAMITHLNSNDVLSLDIVALSHFLLGTKWKPKSEQSLESLFKQLNELSLIGKSGLAISMINSDLDFSKATKEIIQTIVDSFRIQGRTAYIAGNAGSQFVSNIVGTAIAMDLFVKTKYESPLLEKMSNYLSDYYSSDIGFNILALHSYDEYRGNVNPNINLLVTLDENKLMEKDFSSDTGLVYTSSFSLPSSYSNDTLNFISTGKGEISVAVGLRFEPKILNSNPIYRGFLVEKAIRLVDPLTKEGIGVPLTSAKPGSLISILIQITSPDDIFQTIRVIDPLAGCIESIDPNIESNEMIGDPSMPNIPGQYKKDKTIFMVNGMSAGMITIEYKAHVVSSGKFVVPPTKVEVISQPEVMGLSSSQYFVSQ